MNEIYQEILAEIDQQIEQGKWQEAYMKILHELSMPYIPSDVETYLLELKKEYEVTENLKKQNRMLSEEEVLDYLKGDLSHQMMAIAQLSQRNLRNYLVVLQEILDNQPHILLQSVIIEALINQQIHESITIEQDGLQITFEPCTIEEPLKSDGALASIALLQAWFENENPSFLAMCIDCLVKECYLRLPINVEEDESEALCLAIAAYVFRANGAEDELNCFIRQKGLAQTGSFELLLNKHDI